MGDASSRRRSATATWPAVALLLAACTSGGGGNATSAASSTTAPPPSGSAPAGSGDWLTYHADGARTGSVAGGPAAQVRLAWRAELGGAVRGQPLVVGGRVLAATETNRVVALDPGTGKVLWSRSLGTPLRNVSATVGCGNIDPVGVTSTMVVDPATGTLFVVAEISDGGRSVHHQLFGLDAGTGAVRMSVAVDPPLPSGQTPLHLLQRASLALAGGRVYVPFGGHLGDCGHYHGWLVGADVAGRSPLVSFQVAPDGEGGAIWQGGGAPAVDAGGNVYATTGNANPFPDATPDPTRYGESVVKLGPDLKPLAAFKDPTASGDEDLSTGNPVLLPDGTVFSVGKTNVGFFLDQGDLKQAATAQGICGSDPDGGPAYDPGTGRLFVPCRGGGLQVIDAKNHTRGPLLRGADSAPIVVGGHVWALDSGRDTLTSFSASSGDVEQSVDVGSDVPVFASPSYGAGLLLVAAGAGVTAFR